MKTPASPLPRLHRGLVPMLCLLAFCAGIFPARAGVLYVPNASFESPYVPPVSPYATNGLDFWQEMPQPGYYDPAYFGGPWDQLDGSFFNVPYPGEYIDNCDGSQAAFLFALPGAGFFQDYNSLNGTNTVPGHEFNATYKVGDSYTLTLGVIGGGGGMSNGVTLELILYYLDASSNMVPIADTTITNTPQNFPTNTHFVDFSVHVPNVQATNAWAGKKIGIQVLSSVGFDLLGGYWDLDNMRLTEGIDVPNFSFESPYVPPVSPYATNSIGSWQSEPQPGYYDPAYFGGPWDQLTGVFYNIPYPGEYIDNCDGVQAAFLFALPEAGFFQDYNSIGSAGTNTVPTHAFNAVYEAGKSYALTVGLIGGGGGMSNGVPLELILYYRDAASNMITVAATTVTNTPATFPTNTHFMDFSVVVPGVKASDAWAGKNIGIELLSTVGFDLLGGYWDVDNVRLTETVAPSLNNPARSGGVFSFNLQSEPGLAFQIQAKTNIGSTNWTTIGTVTNFTGTTPFSESTSNLTQRFYRAREL